MPMGIIVEAAVAILLAVTIVYCITLNRRLSRLQADRDSLRQMIADLMQATELANSAVKELKAAAIEADSSLSSRLEEAERFGIELAAHVTAGTALVDRIAKITSAARPAAIEPTGGTEKVQSALQQLAMRQRMRGTAA